MFYNTFFVTDIIRNTIRVYVYSIKGTWRSTLGIIPGWPDGQPVFLSGRQGFQKKAPLRKIVSVGQKLKIVILDRGWACLFGGRKWGVTSPSPASSAKLCRTAENHLATEAAEAAAAAAEAAGAAGAAAAAAAAAASAVRNRFAGLIGDRGRFSLRRSDCIRSEQNFID